CNRHGGTAGPAPDTALNRRNGNLGRGIRAGHARSGEDCLRRSLGALEPPQAPRERIGGTVLEGLPGPRRNEDRRRFRTGDSEGMVVRMTTNATWIQVDPVLTQAFRDEAIGRLTRGEAEVVLDFSSVKRIDTNAVLALDEL